MTTTNAAQTISTSADPADDYQSALNCSPSIDDLRLLMTAVDRFLAPLDGAFIDAADITVISSHGYVLGRWWWDTQSEQWRLDIRQYGEERP